MMQDENKGFKESDANENEVEIEVDGTEIEVEPKESKGARQNNGKPHANQYTSGRNDDRGRKE
jgi:hypothetical protein